MDAKLNLNQSFKVFDSFFSFHSLYRTNLPIRYQSTFGLQLVWKKLLKLNMTLVCVCVSLCVREKNKNSEQSVVVRGKTGESENRIDLALDFSWQFVSLELKTQKNLYFLCVCECKYMWGRWKQNVTMWSFSCCPTGLQAFYLECCWIRDLCMDVLILYNKMWHVSAPVWMCEPPCTSS